jgi:uncharacterized membrane protein YdbT with pleckstrin-like domain
MLLQSVALRIVCSMRTQVHTLDLNPEEEVVAIVRRHLLGYTNRLLLSLIWVLIPFFFFFPLLKIGGVGVVVFVALAVSGMIYALRTWAMWWQTMWIVTDERVIDVDHTGFFGRQIVSVPLQEIRKIGVLKRSSWQILFHLGTVKIKAQENADFDLVLESVHHPKQLVELVQHLLTRS